MRKKTKMIIDPKYILIAISVICAILIVVSFKFQDKIEPVRSIVGGVVTPMQKGINTIGVKISDKLEYVNSVKKLTKENKKLKEENILMQIKNIDFKNKSVINLKGETGLVVCLKKDNNIEKNVIKLRNVLIDLKNRKEVYGKVDLTYNDYILYSPYSN